MHHGEVGLPAGARESRGHDRSSRPRRFDAEDQHVLGEPAFLAAEIRTNAQRQALLPQQHVAAVVGADRNDRVVLRKVAMKRRSGFRSSMLCKTAIEIVTLAEMIEGNLPHARHDPHVEHDVDRVRQFDADLAQRRAGRPHEVWHHIHRAPAHRPIAKPIELAIHLRGWRPVVGRPGLLLAIRCRCKCIVRRAPRRSDCDRW